MKTKEMEALAAAVATAINDTIKGPQVAGRILQLEARIAALEAKPSVKFTGTWERGKSYSIGDATTHHGGLWICQAETTGEPSKDFTSWRLAVKSRSI